MAEPMSDVDRLLQEYVREYQAGGEADPLAYLARVSGTDRLELEALIDGYLAHAPRVEVDLAAYPGSLAEKVVDSLSPAITGVSGLWPTVLPALRNAARLRRREVVERLAAALGVASREDKVADYYNQMEQGRLPATGVSERVLEALGGIVGASAERLRTMGGALSAAGPPAGSAPAFARTGSPGEEQAASPAAAVPTPAGEPPEWDEVDELFRGG